MLSETKASRSETKAARLKAAPEQRAHVRVLLRVHRALVERFRAMANDLCDQAMRDVEGLEAWADGGPVPKRAKQFVKLARVSRFTAGRSASADRAAELLQRDYSNPLMFLDYFVEVTMQLAAGELEQWDGRWPGTEELTKVLRNQVRSDLTSGAVQAELMQAAYAAADGPPSERRAS